MKERFGPTGAYPKGRLSEDDSGELRVGATVTDGVLYIYFNAKVAWIAFEAAEAKGMLSTLEKFLPKIKSLPSRKSWEFKLYHNKIMWTFTGDSVSILKLGREDVEELAKEVTELSNRIMSGEN